MYLLSVILHLSPYSCVVTLAPISLSLCHAGLLSEKHPEEHGVHLSPGEKLHHQQSHPQPLPVLSAAEVPGSRDVQGV